MRTIYVVAFLALTGISGCLDGDDDVGSNGPMTTIDEYESIVPMDRFLAQALASGLPPMMFEESVVDACVSYQNPAVGDLYEPTMEVTDEGTIVITGHTVGVDSTGAPICGSWDDGASWEKLPFFQNLVMPGDLPGSTPPITDEIFLVAGDDGWLWGVDITLATFPVNGWSADARTHSYFNPNAYDEAQVVLQADECLAAPAKDRPWGAYANGALLMVSNPASGPAQIGILDVPLMDPITGQMPIPVGVGATTGLGRWNVCAGLGTAPATSAIPGIPDMRDDGLFVVPQLTSGVLELLTVADTGHLDLIVGNKENIYDTEIVSLFPHSTGGEITSVYGQAAFDAEGTLFVAITNNTAADPDDNDNRTGQIHVALSTDGADSFTTRTFVMDKAGNGVRHMYLDGNRFGPSTLMVWAVDGQTVNGQGNPTAWDWYAGHLQLGADGGPTLENAYLIIDEGKPPSAHVTGASVGPDGRAYTAMYQDEGQGGTPMSVFIQRAGPTMPVWEVPETA